MRIKNTRKFLALLLSLALVFALVVPAYADYDYASNARIVHSDYTGKTVILHSNDVHGCIDGYAAMAALKARFTEAGAKVIVVDAGDFSQGTAYVSSSKGATAIQMMNAVGYDVATLGNHEFDFGYAQLMENLKEAKFSVICADVYLDEAGETILSATTVIEADGEEDAPPLRIGFFGMETPETATKVNPGLIKEINFATFDDFYASAQLAIDSLKGQNADLIIVVYVKGFELLEALEASTFCTPEAVGGFPQTSGIEWVLDTTKSYDQGDLYTLNGKESSYYGPASIQRVTIHSINGEPFDENAVYAVVTSNFCAAGAVSYAITVFETAPCFLFLPNQQRRA